jgi:hypothetical protein
LWKSEIRPLQQGSRLISGEHERALPGSLNCSKRPKDEFSDKREKRLKPGGWGWRWSHPYGISRVRSPQPFVRADSTRRPDGAFQRAVKTERTVRQTLATGPYGPGSKLVSESLPDVRFVVTTRSTILSFFDQDDLF